MAVVCTAAQDKKPVSVNLFAGVLSCWRLSRPLSSQPVLPQPRAHHFLAGCPLLLRSQGRELDTSPPAAEEATAPRPAGIEVVRATVLRNFSSVNACLGAVGAAGK
jgi:hypothetical protein